jgi:hypothetical protein
MHQHRQHAVDEVRPQIGEESIKTITYSQFPVILSTRAVDGDAGGAARQAFNLKFPALVAFRRDYLNASASSLSMTPGACPARFQLESSY